MKRIFYILAAVLCGIAAVSCEKNGGADVDVTGEWALESVFGMPEEVNLEVYVKFDAGTFRLYQSLGDDQTRPWVYEGTYTVSGNTLTGRYSDGTRFGGVSGEGYTVSLYGSETMTLTSVYSAEVSTYRRTEIPAEVTESAVAPVRSADTPAPVL